MFDSMRAGKPNLCALPIKHCYIDEYECGVCVAPKPDAIIRGIEAIQNMDEGEREKMGRNGREATLKYFNYRALSESFLSIM